MGDSSAVQKQLKNVQQLQATNGAFAAILESGSVVTWGHARFGGNSSAVQHELKTVRQIQDNLSLLLPSIVMDLSLPGVAIFTVVEVSTMPWRVRCFSSRYVPICQSSTFQALLACVWYS